MLAAERETARTLARNPALFVGGAVAAVAWLVAQAVAAVPVMLVALPRGTQPVFALPLAGVASMLVLPPALAGLYASAREGRASAEFPVGEGVRAYLRGSLRHALDLTHATAMFRVAALVPAAVAFALLLAGDTAVTYWQYPNGGGVPPSAIEDLIHVWLYVTAAGGVGRLVFAFHDLPVLFAGVPPRRGWRAALRFARRRPGGLVRYGAGRLALWSPMAAVVLLEIAVLADASSLLRPLLFVAAALVIGTFTTAALAAHHVVTYERTVEPVLREPTPTARASGPGPESPLVATPEGGETDDRPVWRSRRTVAAWAIAGLLVVAAAGATGGVRVTDARSMPAGERTLDGEATGGEVARAANQVLANASYRSSTRIRRVNVSTGERHLRWEKTVSVDRAERRALLTNRVRTDPDDEEWSRETVYASETRTALAGYGDAAGAARAVPVNRRLVVRRSGDWTVMAVPGYRTMDLSIVGPLLEDSTGEDLRVVERTGDRIVVGATVHSDEEPPEDGRVLAARRVRLVVDRDTGRPRRLVTNETYRTYENGTADDRYRVDEERTFSEYGDPDVKRPDAIGPRGPVEWLWDIVYY